MFGKPSTCASAGSARARAGIGDWESRDACPSRGDHGWLEAGDPEVAHELEIFRGDLASPEAVAGAIAGRSVVFHLGALIPIPYSYRHPREFVSANMTGTLNVLEAARRAEVKRIVHTSTSEVYGTAQEIPIHEEHRLHP